MSLDTQRSKEMSAMVVWGGGSVIGKKKRRGR